MAPPFSVAAKASWTTFGDDTPSWLNISTVESMTVGAIGRGFELDVCQPAEATLAIDNRYALYGTKTGQRVNLCPDPSVRNYYSRWARTGATGTLYEGALTTTASGDQYWYCLTRHVIPGVAYTAAVSLAHSGSARSCWSAIQWLDSGGSTISTSYSSTSTETPYPTYTAKVAAATAPSNAASARVFFGVLGCSSSETHFVKDVLFEATATYVAATPFDGNTSEAAWNGRAYDSASTLWTSYIDFGHPVLCTIAYNGTTYPLFAGEVAGSSSTAPGLDYSQTTVKVADYLDALAGAELRPTITEQILYLGPEGYWPLNEKPGQTAVADLVNPYIGGVLYPSPAGGTKGVGAFGADPLYPQSDTSTALAVTYHESGGSQDAGYHVLASPSGQSNKLIGTSWAIHVQAAVSLNAYANTVFSQTRTSTFADGVAKLYWAYGYWLFSYPRSGGTTTLTSGTLFLDPASHTVEVTSGSFGCRLYVDGVLEASSANVPSSFASSGVALIGAEASDASGLSGTNWFSGVIGHVAVFDSTYVTGAFTATGLTDAGKGYPGENPDDRIGRVLDWLGYAGTRSLDTSTATCGPQKCGGSNALDEVNRIADVDEGIVYAYPTTTGAGIRFRKGSNIWAQASVLTLDANSQHIDTGSLSFDLDRTHLVNDLVGVGESGSEVRLTDSTSIDRYRRRSSRITFSCDDAWLPTRTRKHLERFSRPRPRAGAVDIDLYAVPSLIPGVAALQPGDRVTLTNLPSRAPASVMDFVVNAKEYPQVSEKDGLRCVLQLAPYPYETAA